MMVELSYKLYFVCICSSVLQISSFCSHAVNIHYQENTKIQNISNARVCSKSIIQNNSTFRQSSISSLETKLPHGYLWDGLYKAISQEVFESFSICNAKILWRSCMQNVLQSL